MALASWRDMVATILVLEIHVGAARRGCGATFSFTSIYDACKSTKGVTLQRNWSFTGFAWWLVSIPWNGNRKKEEASPMPRPLLQRLNKSRSVLPIRAGEGDTFIPADSMAAIFDPASPLPPEMIAPA